MSGYDEDPARAGEGAVRAANDQDMIDVLLREWAADREVRIEPGAALAAANAALAEARRVSVTQRRWFPAAVVGGSAAAALAGVLILAPAASPDLPVPGAAAPLAVTAPSEFAAADDTMRGGAATVSGLEPLPQLAASDFGPSVAPPLNEDFPSFDALPDDLLMTSHVFTTRPEEELIY